MRSLFGGNRAAAGNGLRVGQHDEPVAGRGWAPLLALLVLAASACGGDDAERLLTGDDGDGLQAGWERDDQGAPPSVIRIYQGATHCDMDSALLLEIHWPPDGGGAGNTGHTFVRDPDGVFAERTDGSFDPDAELPGGAIPTGWEHGTGVALWLADDLSTAYVVDGNDVEAWPALVGGWICA